MRTCFSGIFSNDDLIKYIHYGDYCTDKNTSCPLVLEIDLVLEYAQFFKGKTRAIIATYT